jgi:Uma2 family endonuclease
MATAILEDERRARSEESRASAVSRIPTIADLLHDLGDISPQRVLLQPAPGTATEADLLRLPRDLQRNCELVDGTLVYKAMGFPESIVAMVLVGELRAFLKKKRLAAVSGPDGHTRFFGNQIRMPDVAVFVLDKLPDRKLPREQVCPVAPDLAVEVLSPGNTPKEMEGRLALFFRSGVRLVWLADARRRTVRVYQSPTSFTELGENDALDGGEILPGFTLSLREWFDESE